MPDGATGGRWQAAPFLDHVATADPGVARAWLNAPADKAAPGVLRAQKIAATGRLALDALLGLAGRHWDAVDAAQLQAALAGPDVRAGDGVEAGATLRLAARWARAVPRAQRTGQWIGAVEGLLAGAVQAEHTGHLALDAVAERARAQMKAAGLLDGGDEDVAGAVADEAAGTDWVATEEEMRGLITLQVASRLPVHYVAMLVRELACIASPARPPRPRTPQRRRRPGGPGQTSRPRRRIDSRAGPAGRLPRDLDQVRVGDSAAFGGPRLARAVLDVAAADADAGTGLAQRTRHFRRVADLDARLHTRLMAAHLAHRPPPTARRRPGRARVVAAGPRARPVGPGRRPRPASSSSSSPPVRPSTPRSCTRASAQPWAPRRPRAPPAPVPPGLPELNLPEALT
ncbi:hypothetical protein QNO09_39035 [Streptomyces sp. 378]|uniref:hypothetical protein n=1 Tax=Streptomyces sp. 378 TaxID=3049412 RepID=UPI0024C394F0|nr:hypothetical protein [Streptomyces sp. 378]MDK1349135.1 hypothetical protein [Streptomyces sp. 378]